MPKGQKLSIDTALSLTRFFSKRTPNTSAVDLQDAFITLSEYRNGAIYVGQYSGYSEWEKHPHGDEIVLVLDGETTLILLVDGIEKSNKLVKNELFVVPENIWHKFETPKGVKILTVTPQPTEHSINKPSI